MKTKKQWYTIVYADDDFLPDGSALHLAGTPVALLEETGAELDAIAFPSLEKAKKSVRHHKKHWGIKCKVKKLEEVYHDDTA